MVQHVAGSGCGGDLIVWKNYGIGLMKFLWQQDPPDVVSRPTKFKIYPFCLPTMQGRRTRVPGGNIWWPINWDWCLASVIYMYLYLILEHGGENVRGIVILYVRIYIFISIYVV